MLVTDQAMRTQATDDAMQWDDELDKYNTAQLKKIIQEYGWPTISLVGEAASSAAWLIVQHADHDPSFQETCLEMLKNLTEGEVSKQNIAYLEDRVRVVRGIPQLYGTQFDDPSAARFGPKAVEDRPNLNKRRTEVGLSSFEEYQKLMVDRYGVSDEK